MNFTHIFNQFFSGDRSASALFRMTFGPIVRPPTGQSSSRSRCSPLTSCSRNRDPPSIANHRSPPRIECESMGEFFKPWRRKVGLLTLVMACVFANAWVRKLPFDYRIQIEAFKTDLRIVLQRGAHLSSNTVTTIGPPGITQTVLGGPKDWHNWIVIPIPYWAPVVPLILLSAYLLLSKQRPSREVEPSISSAN